MSTTKWPYAIGMHWKEAEKIIRNDYPNMSVQVLPQNTMLTKDYRVDRVRIFTDGDGMVVKVPKIG